MEDLLFDVVLHSHDRHFEFNDLREISFDCLMSKLKEMAVGELSADASHLPHISQIFNAMCKAAGSSRRHGLLLSCQAPSSGVFNGYLYRKPAMLEGLYMHPWLASLNCRLDGIRDFMTRTGGRTAVLGISGGKDSTVSAAMLVKALGTKNVVGVFMPNQPADETDLTSSLRAAKAAGLTRTLTVNVREAYDSLLQQLPAEPGSQVTCNLPPRLRMASLYMVAQSLPGGRVINNTNADEAMVGYGTLWGDLAGDLALLRNMSVRQVIATGLLLGLPLELLEIPPADGLTMKTDEEVLGFSYRDVETYREESIAAANSRLEPEVGFKIHRLQAKNAFKRSMLRIPQV